MRLASALVAGLALLAIAAAPASAARERGGAGMLKVYFLLGEQVIPVERPGTTVVDALNALLAGPTSEEAAGQVETYIPAGTPLRSATVTNGVATVDLGEKITIGTNGEALSARITQLVYTVTAVAGVKSVQVLIKGGTPLGLFPGYDLAKPISLKDVERPTVPPPVEPSPEPGKPDAATRALQQRLADLGFLAPGAVDGIPGEQTAFGVIAFQKWAGLSRDGIAGPQTQTALATATRPTPVLQGSGRRIEVLLDRQLVLVIDGNTVARTIHIATGKPGYDTPPGAYTVFRKEENSWSVPFQVWLPWASYFNGGIAFHEYPDVPAGPASHGCVRVPRYDAQYLYSQAPTGTPVTVISRST
jgi:peptidoglycan hydrolase-like protein with peptidoglycan-binding domain